MKPIAYLFLTAIVAANLVSIGCAPCSTMAQSAHDKGSAAEAKAEKSIIGKWKGRIDMPKSESKDPGAEMGEAFVKMMEGMLNPRLEFLSETEFKMLIMSMPVTGRVELDGRKIRLIPEKLMGMTPEQAKQAGNTNFDSEPMEGEISEDYKTIRLNQGEDSNLIFERAADEVSQPVVDKTANAFERNVTGTYSVKIIAPESGPNAIPDDQKQMLEAMEQSMYLELRKDHTFLFNMMLELEGTWSVQGGTIVMKPTGVAGMSTDQLKSVSKQKDIVGSFSSDGRTIKAKGDKPGSYIVFTRK